MSGRANIKVSTAEFERLKDEKPEGVTWGYYLTEIRTVEQTKELVDE